MLALSSYLLGVVELALLVGFSVLGAARLRAAALPELGGPPGWLATAVLALALLGLDRRAAGQLRSVQGAALFDRGYRGRARPSPWVQPSAARGRRAFDALEPSPGAPLAPRADSAAAKSLAAFERGRGDAGRGAGALIHFGAGERLRLATGMTGFDSTWYHGPSAASFFQSGDTFQLHYLAPQYMAGFTRPTPNSFTRLGWPHFIATSSRRF